MFQLPIVPSWCPKILLPVYWVLLFLFYVVYFPVFCVLWLFKPWVRRQKNWKQYAELPNLRR